MTNVLHTPTAPGLALVGDAAGAIDPLFGVGCGFALQGSEWLADSVSPALRGAESLDAGLKRYRRRHASRPWRPHPGDPRLRNRPQAERRGKDALLSRSLRRAHRPGLRGLRLAQHRARADVRDGNTASHARHGAALDLAARWPTRATGRGRQRGGRASVRRVEGQLSERGPRSRAAAGPTAPGPSSSPTKRSSPSTITTGSRESLARARSASAATASATASQVARNSLPSLSWRPRQSSSGATPAQPIATSHWP